MFGGGDGKNDRMDVGGPQRAISSGVKNGELVMSIGEKDCSKIDVFGWIFWGEPPHKKGSNFFLQYSPESCFNRLNNLQT